MFSFWPMTSFCSISLILPLHHPFEQLSLSFTKYLFRVKLFNMTRRTFWEKYFFNTVSLFWSYDVIGDVVLLTFTTFPTSSLFWTTQLNLNEIFVESKVVQHDQMNFGKILFNTLSLFVSLTSFMMSVCSILLLHRLFEQLNLIFSKHI